MDVRRKLEILAGAAKYDASCASSGSRRQGGGKGVGSTTPVGICHSYTPDGRCVSLLKILLTNVCIYDCTFCVNRVSSDTPRARFTTDEVVKLTIDFYKRNYIEGLFLSSGIIQNPDYTMQQLIDVAKKLRTEHDYRGYIHLKAIPLADEKLLAEAGLWCDRLSANIELATDADLKKLAPEKRRAHVETTMRQVASKVLESQSERKVTTRAPRFAPAGQSTQMIVGATAATDAEMLATSSELYNRHALRRVYYSAFSPIPHGDARLPGKSPPLVREHRLYQADWLMRYYGFAAGEIASPEAPNLDLSIDPKLAWALRHRGLFPVDVNKAEREMLLRVPGLGVRSVKRILELRRHRSIRQEDLEKLRVSWKKVSPFLMVADANPALATLDRNDLLARLAPPPKQLSLFDATTARTGEL